MFRLFIVWMTALATALPVAALAAPIRIVAPGAADIPLALPPVELPAAGEPKAAATEIWDAVWTDLEISGYFKLQDPKGYVEKGKGVEPQQFDMSAWTTIGTTVLVKVRAWPAGHANCDPGGNKVCADAYIYNVESNQKLVSKRFRADANNVRQLGHNVANAVIEALFGIPGVFGTRIAAVGSKSGNKEIYVMDCDGHGVNAVTRNGAINLSPAWSPDGQSIAWTSYKKANPDLYIKDLPTGRTRTISSVKGVNTSPSFSPDGAIVALARTSDGDSDIFLVDSRTGAEVRQLTHGGGIDVSPGFSPDGKRIAFASERSGGSQVYISGVGGDDAQRLTFVGDFNIDPVISPKGDQFAFVGRSDGGFDVYVADIDGRNVIRITQDMGDNEDPTWSPDGNYIVFSSTRTGRSELFIATADGRHQTRITNSGGWTQPSWAPSVSR